MRLEGASSYYATGAADPYEEYRSIPTGGRSGEGNPALTADKQEQEKKVDGAEGCQTCKDRKYVDGSNDPGVSFKTPTRISPERSAAMVRGHELEHVGRERSKAAREDREVIAQSVTFQTGVCPECGTPYVAGGTTRTTTMSKTEVPKIPSLVGRFDASV